MTRVDELLEKYSLTRDNATAYIDSIVRMNQSRAAEEMGVHRKTVENYKKRFNEMSEEERVFLIASLFTENLLEERWRELAQGKSDEGNQDGQSLAETGGG